MAHCDRCNRWFSRTYALEQHKDGSSSHWPCYDCGLDYENHNDLRRHYILSPKHHYCEDCDRLFTAEESRRQHMNDAHWYCRKHDRVFHSKYALHSHYKQSSDHHFCVVCEKDFVDEDTLEYHSAEEHPEGHHEHPDNTWLCLSWFHHLCWLGVPNANTGERRSLSNGGGIGASNGRAQGAPGYGTV